MRAARLFALRLQHDGHLAATARVTARLYGSLGATGKGHGSDKAVLLGLAGHLVRRDRMGRRCVVVGCGEVDDIGAIVGLHDMGA